MPKLVPVIWTFFGTDKFFGLFGNYFGVVEILKRVICKLLFGNLGLLRESFCPFSESKSLFSRLFKVVLEFRSCLGIDNGLERPTFGDVFVSKRWWKGKCQKGNQVIPTGILITSSKIPIQYLDIYNSNVSYYPLLGTRMLGELAPAAIFDFLI